MPTTPSSYNKARAKRAGFKKDRSTPSAGTKTVKKKKKQGGKTQHKVIWSPTVILRLQKNITE